MTKLLALVDNLGALIDGNSAWYKVFGVLAAMTKRKTPPMVSNQARDMIGCFSIYPLVDSFRANDLLGLELA